MKAMILYAGLAVGLIINTLAYAQTDLPPRTISETHTQFGCRLAQLGDGDSMCFIWESMPTLLWGCADVPDGSDVISALVPIPAAATTNVHCVTRRNDAISVPSINKCEVTSTLPIGEGPLLPPTVEE